MTTKKKENKRQSEDQKRNQNGFFSCLPKSLGEVFHRLDFVYLFSWIMLFFSIYTMETTDTAKCVAWHMLGLAIAIRIVQVVELSTKRHRIHRVLPFVELLPIVTMLILAFIPGVLQIDKPIVNPAEILAPVRRAIANLLISYCIVLFDKIDTRRIRYKYLAVNVLVFIWGMLSTQLCHLIYSVPGFVNDYTEEAFKHILPLSEGKINGSINWISIGASLFGACVVIVNWFKESPCKQWNPYTVQEIGLSDHVVYFAVAFFSSLLYCSINGMNRASVFPIVGLLGFDVYALYLKNGQDLDKHVMRKVVQKMNMRSLVNALIKEDKECQKDKSHCFDRKTKKLLLSFSCSVKEIVGTILQSDSSPDMKIENYTNLVKYIYSIIPENNNVYSTIGFVFGISSVPPWFEIDKKNKKENKEAKEEEKPEEKIEEFIRSINDNILNDKKSDKKTLRHPYYRLLISGIHAGLVKAIFLENNDEDKWFKATLFLRNNAGIPEELHDPQQGIRCEKTIAPPEEFHTWLVYRWLSIKKPYKCKDKESNDYWKWVDELWAKLN